VDDRVRATVDGMANLPELRKDLQTLTARLEDLERRLADLDR
jgi:polyhydroxyalkanoate synthesis regulator phasin